MNRFIQRITIDETRKRGFLRAMPADPSAMSRSGRLRAPTIRDVARRAGVSVGTASNVLNEKPQVGPALREQVMAAAAELGWRPNGVARSLRQQRTSVVGLCVPLTTSAYFAVLVEAFEEAAAGLGYAIMQVLSHSDPALELTRVETLLARRIDGLVLVPSAMPARTLELVVKSRIPAVVVDRLPQDQRFDTVIIDDGAAMRAVVEHLMTLGHRRLLYAVRYPELVTTRARMASFAATMGERGLAAEGRVLARRDDPDTYAADLERVLAGPEPPTAIIASNSILAEWTLRALTRAGRRWPDDISVVAFDEPAWAELVTPALTCVRQPVQAIARHAWHLLLARLQAGGGPYRHVVLEAELVCRASTGGPP